MQRPGKEEDFVKKKKLMRSSLILQGVYTAGCILDIILCLFYQASYKTSFGRQCAYLALHLTVILLLVPALPLSLIWNIRATPPRQAEDTRRGCWMAWTIASPLFYILCWTVAMCVFVAATGGV